MRLLYELILFLSSSKFIQIYDLWVYASLQFQKQPDSHLSSLRIPTFCSGLSLESAGAASSTCIPATQMCGLD